MEVMMTTAAVRCWMLQSNRHHQQTNMQPFIGPCCPANNWLSPVLKVVQKRSGVSPAIRGRVPPPQKFFISENGEFCCILSGILCALELQESKQETRYRPSKSKGAGSPTGRPGPALSPDWARTLTPVQSLSVARWLHEWLGYWTCDQQVMGTNLSLSIVDFNPGQVVNTHVPVPLSSSSVIWYQRMGGDALRLGR